MRGREEAKRAALRVGAAELEREPASQGKRDRLSTNRAKRASLAADQTS